MSYIKIFLGFVLPQFILVILKNVKFKILYIIYKRDVKSRAKLSPFDYKELSKDMRLVTKEYGWNSFYGLANIIKKLEGLPMDVPLRGAVEHGAFVLNTLENDVDLKQNEIWTFSEARAEFLKKVFPHKIVHSIGPYVQYVDGLYDERTIRQMKAENGKTLLVFPPHSIGQVDVKFYKQNFIKEIKKIKEKYNFDKVIVNLYWYDIKVGRHKNYLDEGFTICTAGHIYDPLFLSRLRSIIELSDMTMGCEVGTHIGYCVALKKSHYFYYLAPKYIERRGSEMNNLGPEEKKYRAKYVDDIKKCFSQYHEELTEKDKSIIKHYWGNFS